MKKILLLCSFIFCSIVNAAETVEVVWPFALGNNQANIIRSMIDSANKNQNKYQFLFISKQGAGGVIAANAVLSSQKLALFANSSSYYLTPLLTKPAYDVDQFNVLSRMCVDRPLVMFSKSLTKLGSAEVTVSVTPATIQALVPKAVKQKVPSFNYLEVPFKSGPDGTMAMLSGVVDISVDWLGATSSVVSLTNGVNIVGITGARNVNGLPLLPGTENLVGDVFLFVPKTIDQNTYKELYNIFQDALGENSETFCKNDFGKQVKTEWNSLDKIHSENKIRWQKLIGNTPKAD